MSQTSTAATSTTSATSSKMPSSTKIVNEVPPGHRGNLNDEQRYKLKEAYLAVMISLGVAPKDTKVAGKAPEVEVKKGRLGFSRTEIVPEDRLEDAIGTFTHTLKGLDPTMVNKQIASVKRGDHPDQLMLRFLRARKWDVPKALIQMGDTLHWRLTTGHVDLLLERGEKYYINTEPNEKYINLYKKGMSVVHGADKAGRPIVIISVRRHNPRAQTELDMERYTVSAIEAARMCLHGTVETSAVIFDMTGFSLANMDYSCVRFIIKCFEAHYPESLGYLNIHNAPWVFGSVWNIIKGWIDPVVASKIHFTKGPEDLLKTIDSDQLPTELGGTSDYAYEYIPPKEGEDDLLNDKATREKLIHEREALYAKFEQLTLKWITTDGAEAEKWDAERQIVSQQLVDQYWKTDPYTRSRTIADRDGSIGYFAELRAQEKAAREAAAA